MEIDDILSQLNSEIEASLSHLNEEMGFQTEMGTGLFSDTQFCTECGAEISTDCRFCPQCGCKIEANVERSGNEHQGYAADSEKVGILLTDSWELGAKYEEAMTDMADLLQELVEKEAERGIKWKLLDAARYKPVLGREPSWLDYNELISEFMEEEGIAYGMKTPLLIVGGDDVIPIPMVEDVFGSSDSGFIPCDMCYGFTGNYFSDFWDGDHTITEQSVRNTVARLPLEDGELQTSFSEDIESYFDECSTYYDKGLAVDSVMMAANASWLPASQTMSEHLPLVNDARNTELEKEGMYVCPPVSPEKRETIKPVRESMDEAGMLLFNLHGSDGRGASGFFHDSGEAFRVDMLDCSVARVLNTVACYGARYHGYEREDSMLLNAFYNYGFLLYAGSLIPVPMTDLDVPDGVEVHEGSGSEHLMPIYCMEQYAGLTAGEAMMKAKLEYFNTFRHLERDDFSLATIMMFSLYGHPFLRLQRDEKVLKLAEEKHVLPKLPHAKAHYNAPVRMKRLTRLMGNTKNGSGQLLADIRREVDANLAAIHQTIQQNLYDQLNLEPRCLHHIDSYAIGDEKGYLYTYVDNSKIYNKKTMVEVGENGQTKRVFKTK